MSLLDNDFFNGENVPKLKLALHLAQIILAFIIFCMEIAVFRDADSAINGRNGWTFAVVFLSVPAWIYLVMAPRYVRTQRFAKPAAMVTVDAVFAIIWLSAFSTQAAYNTANSCGGACGVSKAIVAMGFFAFLCWCATTFLSIFTLKYYEANTALPGYGDIATRKTRPSHVDDIDPDKAAFSTAPHDEEYARLDMEDRDHDDDFHHHPGVIGGSSSPYGAPSTYDGSGRPSDPYGATTASQVSYTSAGGSSVSPPHENPFRTDNNPFDNETEYGGSTVGGRYNPPSVHDEYDATPTQPVAFPSANYER